MPILAGGLDVSDILASLAAKRCVFHSEADFQHALAWEAHSSDPELAVRLETHPEPGARLDLLLRRATTGEATALELKYTTAKFEFDVAGERYLLKNHGATDTRCYDIVKDIARLERFVDGRQVGNGVLVAITNAPWYWTPPARKRPTAADEFRVFEECQMRGTRSWSPTAGNGTTKGREQPINLRGSYRLHWEDYSTIHTQHGQFRALVVEVLP